MTRKHGGVKVPKDQYATADVGMHVGGHHPESKETRCGCCWRKAPITKLGVIQWTCECPDKGRCGKCGRCPDHCCSKGWTPTPVRA
jgi:hypothetical protein